MENKRKTIMLVDDDLTNLTIGKSLLSDTYNVFTIPSGEKLFDMLAKTLPDLILLDIEMPGMNGYDVLRRLKSTKETSDIPVIFLTAMSDQNSELKGLTLGAVDYISKPFSPGLLHKRIDLHLLVKEQRDELVNYSKNLERMVKEKTDTVLELQNVILKTVAELVEFRDSETGGHIERTQNYLKVLLGAIENDEQYRNQLADWDMQLLVLSTQLHDVGKISISDAILQKPGRLTPEEFDAMKKHTSFGEEIINKIERSTHGNDFLHHAKIFAGAHHEKWDGSGYPRGLKGTEIPLQGRLMAIVDVYDALISKRPYKEPFSHEQTVSIIRDGSGTHFEPALVDAFLRVADEFDRVTREFSG